MGNDRPFDDLPDWLNETGQPSGQTPEDDPFADMAWATDKSAPSAGDKSAHTGVTGDLPWLNAKQSASSGEGGSGFGVTGDLPWLQDSGATFTEPSFEEDFAIDRQDFEAGLAAVAGEVPQMENFAEPDLDDLEWINEIDLTLDEEAERELSALPEPETPTAPELLQQDYADWLNTTEPAVARFDQVGDLDFPEPEFDDLEDIDDLVASEPVLAEEGVVSTFTTLKRLETGETSALPSEGTVQTFEEWERQQAQEAFLEENAERIALESAVPDWFQDEPQSPVMAAPSLDDLVAAPDTKATADDYVPSWFMGLEDHSVDDAPDWVKKATTDPLQAMFDTSSLAPPEPEPTIPDFSTVEPEVSADVPDWFKVGDFGAEAASAGPDWFSSFATEPSPPMQAPVEAPSSLLSATKGSLPPPPPSPPDVFAAPEPSFDLPDTGALVGGDDLFDLMPSAVDEEELPAEIEPEAPAWLLDFEPSASLTTEESAPAVITDFADFDLEAVEQEEMPEWLGDMGDLDFAMEEAETEAPEIGFSLTPPPAKGFDSSRIDEKELRELSRKTNLDDLLGFSQSSLMPVPVEPKRKHTSALMTPVDEESPEALPDLLFGELDEDVLAAIEQADLKEDASAGITETKSDEVMLEKIKGDWVDEIRPDMMVSVNVGGLQVEFEQQRLADLPEEYRRLRERSQTVAQKSKSTREEEQKLPATSPLAGITGGLTVMPVAPAVGETTLSRQLRIAAEHRENAQLLASLLAVTERPAAGTLALEEPRFDIDTRKGRQAARQTSRKRTKKATAMQRRLPLERLLIMGVLFIAVIVPFITDGAHFADEPEAAQLAAEQPALIGSMETLQPDELVLVIFEYGPTGAGELNPLAEAVLRDIFHQNAVPIVTSTNPLGVLNARNLVETLADDGALLDAINTGRDSANQKARLTSREDYFLLRYIPGGAVGIRALSQSENAVNLLFVRDNEGKKTGLDLGTVDGGDFAAVIVIGETVDDIRNWAEQFDIDGLPKMALVTSAIEPIARTYTNADAYQGYLAGYRDTYRYNALRNSTTRDPYVAPDEADLPNPELAQWHSITLGALVIATIIGLGILLNIFRFALRRRAS